MSARSSLRNRPPRPPEGGFLSRLLDPIDGLSEAIFSVLILLTFTIAFRLIKLSSDPNEPVSPQYVTELFFVALGAIVAWGVIDGVLYALLSVFARGEKHRLLARIQTATSEDEGIEAVADQLDHILEPITSAEQRRLVYGDVLAHLQDSSPQPVTFTRDDFTAGLGCVLIAVVSVVPSLTPLVLFRQDPLLAIRLSNLVSFGVLFYAGYLWGRYSGSSPWKTGLLLIAVAAILVVIAIAFGG